MTEIKKTLVLLRTRWPEVTFILGFGFLVSLLHGILKTHQAYSSWMGLIGVGLLLIEVLIYLGFLRTVCLESNKRQSLLNLLYKGKHFFWRFCGIILLYIIVLVLLVQVIFPIMKIFTPIEGSLGEAASIIKLLCSSTAKLILMKLYLFSPALIIVLDCGVFESFKFSRKCKLLEAKELLAMYLARIATLFICPFLSTKGIIPIVLHSILSILYYFIWNLLSLMIFVMAVRFVSSLNLEYDSITKNLNKKNLLKPQTED